MKNLSGLLLFSITILCFHLPTRGQFPPPAGQPGSTAIYKDSSIFISWAKSCITSIGFINIADTTIQDAGSNKANFGVPTDATGISDDHVVSLGDGGSATLTFDPPIADGEGFDFAVFENGLNDTFLELAFVEVCSDGERYVRFPPTSLTPEDPQVGTFGSLDATRINNLAGKYRVFYGTPFDLGELADSSGLDIMHIRSIRIMDVVGCMKPGYSTFDSYGHKVNDPWPTNFYTGGFDLDAVGVIHEAAQAIDPADKRVIAVFPNPTHDLLKISLPAGYSGKAELSDLMGRILFQGFASGTIVIDMTGFKPGVYIGRVTFGDGKPAFRKIIRQ